MTTFRDAFPILYVDDVRRAIDFYVSSLGCEVSFRWPPEGEGEPAFAFLRLEPLGFGVASPAGDPATYNPGRGFELCVYADDAARRLRAAGAEDVRAPVDEPWDERRAYLRDPAGHLIHVAQRL